MLNRRGCTVHGPEHDYSRALGLRVGFHGISIKNPTRKLGNLPELAYSTGYGLLVQGKRGY